jgi:uncharacterized SAM-binding protein YcdF (DUF218 family)
VTRLARLAALGGAAAAQVLLGVLAAFALPPASRPAVFALGALAAWALARATAASRRAATLGALGSTLLDAGLGAWVPFGVPWTHPAWLAARALSVALGAWCAGRWSDRGRGLALAVTLAVTLAGALFVAEIAHCVAASSGDPPRRVGAAVVLGFGLRDDGTPSPVFLARIARGVGLHRAGLADRVLFTGGVGRNGPAESVAAARVAAGMGLPEAASLREERSHTTRENLREAARLLRARGLAAGPVAVVSDTFHLARARRLARAAGLDPVMVAAVSPAWTDRRRATWWVLREASLLAAGDLTLGRR